MHPANKVNKIQEELSLLGEIKHKVAVKGERRKKKNGGEQGSGQMMPRSQRWDSGCKFQCNERAAKARKQRAMKCGSHTLPIP